MHIIMKLLCISNEQAVANFLPKIVFIIITGCKRNAEDLKRGKLSHDKVERLKEVGWV